MFKKLIAMLLSALSVILTFLGIAHYPMGLEVDMSKFTLTFEDEFDGELDRSVWSGHYTYGNDSSVRRGAYWNNYIAYTKDGNLVIPLQYLADGMGGTGAGWYSAGLDTDSDAENGFAQKYGYFECRCILPKCAPAWSAFWLMNEGVYNEDGNGKDGTEIDIFESNCYGDRINNAVTSNLHFDNYGEMHQAMGAQKFLIQGDPYSEYNTYGLEWNEEEYIFYINGVETFRTDYGGVSQNEEYLILSLELGGENAVPNATMNTNETYEFIVDYVRVYQYNDLLQ